MGEKEINKSPSPVCNKSDGLGNEDEKTLHNEIGDGRSYGSKYLNVIYVGTNTYWDRGKGITMN